MRKKHLRQFLFCISEKEFKEVKKKAPKRGKKEYDKKRIVEILVFGVCIQLRRIVLRGVQEAFNGNKSSLIRHPEKFCVKRNPTKRKVCEADIIRDFLLITFFLKDDYGMHASA